MPNLIASSCREISVNLILNNPGREVGREEAEVEGK